MPRKKKATHGGTRKGAGRKPGEQSVRVRVPLSKLEQVIDLIKPEPDTPESIAAKLDQARAIMETFYKYFHQ